jgi:thiamine-phosphate pyrophosphorylase
VNFRELRGECPLLLYYITDRSAFAADESTRRRLLLKKINEAAKAGVDYIQLREKDLSTRELESLAREAVRAIREALPTDHHPRRTALLINSRTDVALAAGAQGVHLRSEDVSPQDVNAVWKVGMGAPSAGSGQAPAGVSPEAPLIAVSCHSTAEVLQAAKDGATFAVFAPVFEKKDASPAGLTVLRQACAARIPVLALGGVTLSNAHSCLEAGASGIAAIRLFQENNIAAIAGSLRSSP